MTMAALAVLSPPARAAERVTLRNGFVHQCDHHAQVEGRVRLYLSPGEDNYIEFAPEQIAPSNSFPIRPRLLRSPPRKLRPTPAKLTTSRPGRDAHPRRQ